jgi:hypothetical protein
MSDDYPEIEYVVVEKKPRAWYKRPGCLVGIVIWFIAMLLPLFLIALAAQEEITIQHSGDVPDKHLHPLLQVRLVMDADNRGLNITNATLHRKSDTAMCVQSNVRFVLWQGDGDPVTFCRCYERDAPDTDWSQVTTEQGDCP